MTTDRHLTRAELQAIARARSLRERTHYFAQAGVPELGADARTVAAALLDFAATLEAERGARQAIQERRDACLLILQHQAGDATLPDAFRARARAAVETEAAAAFGEAA